jgi:hypothetical protein
MQLETFGPVGGHCSSSLRAIAAAQSSAPVSPAGPASAPARVVLRVALQLRVTLDLRVHRCVDLRAACEQEKDSENRVSHVSPPGSTHECVQLPGERVFFLSTTRAVSVQVYD